MIDEKKPPQSIDGERGILGCMLLSEDAIDRAMETLDKYDFYNPTHSKIFQAMISIMNSNQKIDIVTVSDYLTQNKQIDEIGGRLYLAQLIEEVVTPSHANSYIRMVQEASIKRELIELSTQTINESYSGSTDTIQLLDTAESRIFQIADKKLKGGFIQISDAVKDAFEILDKLHNRKGEITGLTTGYKKIDEMTMGFQKSDFIVIAGRPSMGKTALALNVIRANALRHNVPVAVFSLEMSRQQIALRLLASEAKVDSHAMRSGKLSKTDFSSVFKHLTPISKAPIFIDDSPGTTIVELKAKARRLQRKENIGMIIIDYLQLMTSNQNIENRQQEVSNISRSLKGLARELNIPVIVLSQLSRLVERREKGAYRPQLADLRESGAIEQDADMVMFIYRPEVYNIFTVDYDFEDKGENKKREVSTVGLAEIIIGKQRNGPIGSVYLHFHKEHTSFEEYTYYDMTKEAYKEKTRKDKFGGV